MTTNTLSIFRSESKGKGDVATEENPAYGLSGLHRRPAEDEGDYAIPHYTQAPSGAPQGGSL